MVTTCCCNIFNIPILHENWILFIVFLTGGCSFSIYLYSEHKYIIYLINKINCIEIINCIINKLNKLLKIKKLLIIIFIYFIKFGKKNIYKKNHPLSQILGKYIIIIVKNLIVIVLLLLKKNYNQIE